MALGKNGFSSILRLNSASGRTSPSATEKPTKAFFSQLNTIYDHFPAILFCIGVEPNDQFRFLSINQRFLMATGLSRDQVEGRWVHEIIPSSSYSLVSKNYKKALSTKAAVQWDEVSVYPTGRKHGEVHVTPILAPDGSCSLLMGIVYDITARVQADEERKQYFNFFQTSSDLMCIVGSDKRLKKVNPALVNTLGYCEEELVSKIVTEFIHSDDLPPTLGEFNRLTQDRGSSINFENRAICKDGSFRWISWRTDFDRTEELFYAIGTDITEKKKVEAELMKARAVAEAALQTKSKFLDMAAHELRTPITIITILQELMQKQLDTGKPVTNGLLDRLRRATSRLTRLVVDLLDISRMERGLLKLRLQEFDIVVNISRCIEDFQIQSPERIFNFLAPTQPIRISADPVRINQVLSNLLDNAIKYTPAESLIEIKLQENPEFVRIYVNDTGPGISKTQQKTLFSAFSRGATDATLRASGLGLGLCICHEIMQLHGGRIEVMSEEGKGSSFCIELPYAKMKV